MMNVKKKNKFMLNDISEEITNDAEVVEETKEEVKEEIEKPSIIFGKVKVENKLNIRENANADAKILTTVNNGDTVKILADANDIFYNVELNNGVKGYAMKKFIEV